MKNAPSCSVAQKLLNNILSGNKQYEKLEVNSILRSSNILIKYTS